MDRWHKFHVDHFQDPARRAWFAAQLNTQDNRSSLTRQQLEDEWTTLKLGETESQWQARNGLKHLTPGAAQMFDQSRRFREQRMQEEAAENGHATGRNLQAMHQNKNTQ